MIIRKHSEVNDTTDRHIAIVTEVRNHIVCLVTKKKAHTTLGLKGGSTSLFSSTDQLMVLKNGCARMSPTTPNLRLGSRSNNWNSDDREELILITEVRKQIN